MKTEMWTLDRIKPYSGNPRRIGESAVRAVRESIQRFGWRQPIVVDGDGVVVVGHTRLEAAKALGLEEAPVHIADTLSPDEARAYRLSDNRTGEISDWDFKALEKELAEISMDDLPGFDMLPDYERPEDTRQVPRGRSGSDIERTTTDEEDATPVVDLRAPFPWYGNKRRWAKRVWARLGDPKVYAEPFFGSGALLLARPPSRHDRRKEIVVDLDGYVANFWRAVQADPMEVARHAWWPVNHHDLAARGHDMAARRDGFTQKVLNDPRFFDSEMAGWFAWGISTASGGQFLLDAGIHGGRWNPDREAVLGSRPIVTPSGDGSTGTGKLARKPSSDGAISFDGADRTAARIEDTALAPRMIELAERMRHVIVFGGSWSQCTGDSVLSNVATSEGDDVGIVLDPPYLSEDRTQIYHGEKQTNDVARESWEWAVANGHQYRIAYFCHEGDFDPLDGWETDLMSMAGIHKADRRNQRADCCHFSPACLKPGQIDVGGGQKKSA